MKKTQTNFPHESAILHVTGEARYIDDLAIEGLLHGHVVTSPYSHARIVDFDLSAAKKLDGVFAVLCAEDIPGENQMGPIFHDEPVMTEKEVNFIGQCVFLIAAKDEATALHAEQLIKITYEPLPAITTIYDAISRGELLQPERKIECGDITSGFISADHIIIGELEIGGQEHWYLETQVSLAIPQEKNEMKVVSSTQNPAETQALVAEVLGIPRMEIEVEVRRLGGAFGGKESQGNHIAIWAALLARATYTPVKVRLSRDVDQKITGKRHPFLAKYKAGFSDSGEIIAAEFELNCNGGATTDLTMAILERAMMHAENSYSVANMRIIGRAWKTNLPSNTAFRGFGGPQGMAVIETIMDRIARHLKKDAAEIRYVNFYGIEDRCHTPYGQLIENNRLYILWDQLVESSKYFIRRKEIVLFNKNSIFFKRGIALTPVKFGISFTTAFLNQAGALVHIYRDGSIMVNHGGTEMGQGLNTKIQQIAALEFGISAHRVKVTATNTSKVPNTSPTAASSGTDMNGMAVVNAIETLKKRISETIATGFNKDEKCASLPENIVFSDGMVLDSVHPERNISFEQAISKVYFDRVSLSSTGFYQTPGVYFDRMKGQGHPFYYFAYGMAVSEVELDILTGSFSILRTDILHDAGESLNEQIDMGQVEGAFIQGVGWCTTEECKYSANGNLLNHSPDTYKIPGIRDIPQIFNTTLLKGTPNPSTVRKSKAVGEPPLMLGFSVWLAIKDAISAVGNHKFEPDFRIPATNEYILLSIDKIQKEMHQVI